MNVEVGKLLIALGVFIVTIGIVVYFFSDWLKWLGNLPGDIRVERENFKFYFPISTMVLISLIITIVLNLLKKLF